MDDRDVRSPINDGDRAQTDEREVENGKGAGDNPERQDRSPRDDAHKEDENKE